MDCKVFDIATGKEEDTTPLLVLARAYHAAWCSLYGAEPLGWHRIMPLGILLDFRHRPDLGSPAVGTPGVDLGSQPRDAFPGA
jgi:hypothetical protein